MISGDFARSLRLSVDLIASVKVFSCGNSRFCYHSPTKFSTYYQLGDEKDLRICKKGSVRVLSNAHQVSIMRDL